MEIKAAKGCISLKIFNKYPHDPRGENPLLLTTKEDAAQHGICMGIVRNIVKKYGGSFRFSYENGYVQASVLLPMEEELRRPQSA